MENKPDNTPQEKEPLEKSAAAPKRDWLLVGLLGVTAVLVLVAIVLAVVDTKKMKTKTTIVQVASETPVSEMLITSLPEEVVQDTVVALPTSGPANCSTFSLIPTADPTTSDLFPAVSVDDWVQGSPDAAVTLVVYSDFM